MLLRMKTPTSFASTSNADSDDLRAVGLFIKEIASLWRKPACHVAV